jgi:hypothetical protein
VFPLFRAFVMEIFTDLVFEPSKSVRRTSLMKGGAFGRFPGDDIEHNP